MAVKSPATNESHAAATFSRSLAWRRRLGLVGVVLLSLYDLALVNLICLRHPWRIDLTEERIHTLASETLARLELVKEEIRVILPLAPSGDPLVRAHEEVLRRARMLLGEIMARQPLIRVVAEFNVFTQPDRWQALAQEYDLAPTQWNQLLFCAGEDFRFRQRVNPQELAALEAARDPRSPPAIREFRGERVILDALMRLVHRERRRVYFTEDHGEPALEARADQPVGLAALRHDLEGSGFEARPLELSRLRHVPEDCALLVVAGPERPFDRSSVEKIERYLLGDGRLFVALGSARTALEDLLEEWGVQVLPGRVHMRGLSAEARFDTVWVRAGEFNKTHPITRPFTQAPRFDVRLWEPRPLKAGGSERNLLTEPLLGSGKGADGGRFFIAGEPPPEIPESYVLATATHQAEADRPPPGWTPRRSRIVTVGASNFLRDRLAGASAQGGYLTASHRDFFMNCVHWLAGEEEQAALGGQEPVERTVPMTPARLRFLLVTAVLIVPGIFLSLGCFVYFLRRQ